MTIEDQASNAATAPPGTVVGAPRIWLLLEGLTLLVGTAVAFSTTHQSWWLALSVLLLPDVFAVGYTFGKRLGAHMYNVAHATPLPALLVGLGWWQDKSILLAVGIVWLGHVGMDRMLTFGLKYSDDFQHTHLSGASKGHHKHRTA
jgi:lysylphosphatidylglycerol synthetase-like protein (DUF2156 family)